MSAFTQEPGQLDIKLVPGDDLSISLNFGMNLEGYTFEAGVGTNGDTGIPFAIEIVDISAGILNLRMQGSDTEKTRYLRKFYFKWTYKNVSRTILAGTVEVI